MTSLDRRQFLRLNAAALAGAALAPATALGRLPGPGARTRVTPPNGAPGFYRFDLGDLEITVLSDGHFHFPMELVTADMDPLELQAYNVEPEAREEYFQSRMVPSDHIPLQASPVLIDSGDRRVLVDTGFGEESPPTAGRLSASLEAAGTSAESIDAIVLTHAHPDHLGGLLDPATGAPVFPNAEVVLSDTELEFWTGDDARSALEPRVEAQPLVAGTRAVLAGLGDRIRTIRMDGEVATGIRSVPSPGHTPGHICIVVEAGRDELLLTGDAIVFTHVSFENPEWRNFVDLESERAGRTRRRLLDRAATDAMLILGYHFPFPGLGYALPYGNAFRWHPAGWTVLA